MSDPIQLYCQDAVDFLRGLANESVDLFLTDPPYSSLEKHRARGTTTRLKVSDGSSNAWFPVVPNSYFEPFFVECYRVAQRNCHMYVYTDFESMFPIKAAAEAAGFYCWKALVWDKMKIGMGYHYRARCEFILFFEKGKRKLHDLGMPDVFDLKEDAEGYVLECARIRNGYPTEKPVMVSEKLILQSSEAGGIVCDPFMGSGSTGEAAIKHGRRFIGCDVTEKALQVATSRLKLVFEGLGERQTEMFPNEKTPLSA